MNCSLHHSCNLGMMITLFPHFSQSVQARTMMEACMEEGCIQQDLSGSSSHSLSSLRQSLEEEACEVLDPFIEIGTSLEPVYKGTEHIFGSDVSPGWSTDCHVHTPIWTRVGLEICTSLSTSRRLRSTRVLSEKSNVP